ncbi:MAG: hypothetical protein ACP5RD_00525 [bacterium]
MSLTFNMVECIIIKSSSDVLVYGRIGRSRGSVNLPVVILHITKKYITRYITYNSGIQPSL